MQQSPMFFRIFTVAFFWISMATAAVALTLDASVVIGLRVSANDNKLDRLRSEIGYIASRVAPNANGLDLQITEDFPDDPEVKLKVSGEKLEEAEGQRILKAIQHYVRLRMEGHSQQYATFLVLHGSEPWPKELREVTERAPSICEEIAFPWLRRLSKAPLAYPAFPADGKGENVTIYYVIDGDLAWYFLIPKRPAQREERVFRHRFDAIEFSPAVSAMMHKVFEAMKKEGRVPTPERSPGAKWWYEFQERLEQQAGLDWRTPVELNPEASFD